MIIIITFLSFLIWNIFNETLFLKYNGIKSRIFQRDWHLYDAIFRVFLFTSITINEFGVTYLSGKLLLVLFLLYHVLFDIGFNIKRTKDLDGRLNLQTIFHLGNNTIDRIIRSIGVYFTKIQKFNTPNTVSIVNLIIKLLEISLSLWILLNI